MTLAKKLSIGLATLGLAGTLFFGKENYYLTTTFIDVRDKIEKLEISREEKNKQYEEFFKRKDINLYAGYLYCLSILTAVAGGGLYLYDTMEKKKIRDPEA